jgi:hypothetical protein
MIDQLVWENAFRKEGRGRQSRGWTADANWRARISLRSGARGSPWRCFRWNKCVQCTGDGSTDATGPSVSSSMHRCTVEFYLSFSFLLASIAIRCLTVVRVHAIEILRRIWMRLWRWHEAAVIYENFVHLNNWLVKCFLSLMRACILMSPSTSNIKTKNITLKWRS